jgi:putative aldouronate transport system substrate-binding protein
MKGEKGMAKHVKAAGIFATVMRLGRVAGILVAAAWLGHVATAGLTAAEPPMTITIMTRTFSGDPIREDAEAKRIVEEYCNVKLKIDWVPSTTYDEKMNLVLASGSLPMVMIASNNKVPSIVKAVRDGAFWEIGPYLKEYGNLGRANPITLWNSSFDGKIFGLYSDRPLGRNGIIYRADWLKKLGLSEPKTIDDFYKMLVAFRDRDPDGNGKNDTYGMVVPYVKNNPIVFKNMLPWFGGPNEWGVWSDGTLQPAHLFPEYMDCLKFWKKMYDEKLINEDFAVLDPNKWNDPIVQDRAGVIVDVVNSKSSQLNQIFEAQKPGALMDVMGAVAGPRGLRSMATSGFGSIFLFSKSAIRDLATLKKVLAFENLLGDKKMQDTCSYGVLGKHYQLIEGFVRTNPVTDTTYPKNDFNDLNQILSFIPPENMTAREQKPYVAKYEQVMRDNVKIVVGNPAAPFASPTQGTKGAQLDTIIMDAHINFIVGKIDLKGWNDAIALWRASGGDQVIKEINDDFKKYGANAPR